MKVLKMMLWTALGLATLSSLGCVRGYERERVVVERRPVYVEPVRREVIVVPPPRPPLVEVHVR